jgi:C2 domain
MKNLEGVLEILILEAEFPKKNKGFKTYFEFFIGNKTQKTKLSSGSKPEWPEKIVFQYNSESLIFYKLYKKNIVLKDKIISDEHIDLSLLKSSYRQEQLCRANYKNKLNGKFKIVLSLFPYKVAPRDVYPDLCNELLVSSYLKLNEEVYSGQILSSGQEVLLHLITFDDKSFLQDYKNKLELYKIFSSQNVCKILRVAEKITDTRSSLLIIFEKSDGELLYEHIINRKVNGNFWKEDELVSLYSSMLSLMSDYEKNKLYHGDLNPLSFRVGSTVCLTNLGIATKPYDAYLSDVITEFPELRFPYFSPLNLQNYYLLLQKKLLKPFDFIKSDVFSLGLVFLHMASLAAPVGLNDEENSLSARIEFKVSELPYSETIKTLISKMLTIPETKSPTFTKLAEELKIY